MLNLVGKDGESLEELAYGEFGQFRNRSGRRQVQPFAFTGYQMDEVSALYFAQARRYDAGTGRFVSEDKVRGFAEVPVTLNCYGYCWNEPANLTDLDGNLPTIVMGAIIGGVVGGVGSIVSDVCHRRNINWKKAGINTLKGAAGGAVIGTDVGAISYLASTAGVGSTVVATMKTGATIGQAISSGVDVTYQATSKKGKLDMGEVAISGAGGALSGMLMGLKCGYPSSILGNSAVSGTQSILNDVYTGKTKNLKKDAIINSTIGALAGLYGGRGACYGQTYMATDIINIRFGIFDTKEYVINPLLIKKSMKVSALKTLFTTVFSPSLSEFTSNLQAAEKE